MSVQIVCVGRPVDVAIKSNPTPTAEAIENSVFWTSNVNTVNLQHSSTCSDYQQISRLIVVSRY